MKKSEKQKKPNVLLVFAISLILSYATAFIGSIFTVKTVSSAWYASIKPSITPPSYVFPIVWNILFFLIALSLFFAWMNAKKGQKLPIALAFAANLILNALWSFLFFGLKSPFLAFLDIIFLLGSIIALMQVTAKVNKKSPWLLLPYLLWVIFAAFLNYLMIQF